jgi:hypothetical protein
VRQISEDSVRKGPTSPNTVHFTILMAAVKLIQAVGWGARGRSL